MDRRPQRERSIREVRRLAAAPHTGAHAANPGIARFSVAAALAITWLFVIAPLARLPIAVADEPAPLAFTDTSAVSLSTPPIRAQLVNNTASTWCWRPRCSVMIRQDWAET